MQRFLKYLPSVIFLWSSLVCSVAFADTRALAAVQATYAKSLTVTQCPSDISDFSVITYEQKNSDSHIQNLTEVTIASSSEQSVIRFCASELKNAGNAPFILYHGKKTPGVVVLFHGLSDSPFYMESIATAAFAAGHNVVVGLLPGHGLRENALAVLHDPALKHIWRQHVAQIVTAATPLGEDLILGGFSTGGALVTDYALQNIHEVKGLALFSGALRLPSNAEALTKFPFAKYIAKWTELSYATIGDNPFKYPSISSYAASELMAIIRDIRQILRNNKSLALPIFVAHSEDDWVTPIAGIEQLMANIQGDHTFFKMAKTLKVCHDAVPLNEAQVSLIPQSTNVSADSCSQKRANPVHAKMLALFEFFLTEQVEAKTNISQ